MFDKADPTMSENAASTGMVGEIEETILYTEVPQVSKANSSAWHGLPTAAATACSVTASLTGATEVLRMES